MMNEPLFFLNKNHIHPISFHPLHSYLHCRTDGVEGAGNPGEGGGRVKEVGCVGD
jgi:hypothetical protein